MSESLGEAVLELSTDESRLNSGLARGEKRSMSAMTRMKGAVRGMSSALSVGFTLPMLIAAKGFKDELVDIDDANAQTGARIKSTGGIAGVTKDHINDLSTSLQNLSGMDDQAIQSGENMLLTFTNIRNRVGENNDIFDQASLAVANFAVAMKTDPKNAALMLGKALNDPAEGYAKLKRAGVTFSDAQVNQIKTMQKAGDIAGAQKVILSELATEFGSSAEAAGGTDAAKYAVMIDNLKGIGAELMRTLLPAFRQFVTFIGDLATKFQALSPHVKEVAAKFILAAIVIGPVLATLSGLAVVIEGLSAVIGLIITPVGAVVAALAILGVMWLRTGNHMQVFRLKLAQTATWVRSVAFPAIVDGARRAMAWYQSNIAPTIKHVVDEVRRTLTTWFHWGQAAWAKWGGDITKLAKAAFTYVRTTVEVGVKVIGKVINALLAVLRGDWKDAWANMKGAVSAALDGAIALLKARGGLMKVTAKLLWSVIKAAVPAALKGLGSILVAQVTAEASKIGKLSTWFWDQGAKLGKDMVTGIASGITGQSGVIVSAMTGVLGQAVAAAKERIDSHSPSRVFRDEIGRPIMDGIALGMTLGLPGVLAAQSMALDKLRDAGATAVASAQYQADVATAAYRKVGTLKAAQKALATARKTEDSRILAATHRIASAEAAVIAARRTKGAADDRMAQADLANAKVNMHNQRLAAKAAATNLVTVKKLAAAYTAAQTALKQAVKDAKTAEDDAQAALDKVQQHQDDLQAALDDIKDQAALRLSGDDLNDALAGGATTDSLGQRIKDLKKEYDELAAYLRDNAAELSASVQADIVATMASTMQSINDTEKQVSDILNPPANDSSSTSAPGTSGSDSGAPSVQVVQNFSSEPDMWAASHSAMFAYQTVGLVGG